MKSNNSKKRRQFLKNISLATFSIGMTPHIGHAENKSKKSLLVCDMTTLDYYGQGPFYRPNAPEIPNNKLAEDTETGTRLLLSGRIFNLECNQFIPNVTIEVWHANDAGQYDNDGFNLRGTTTTNEQGFYMFETILPGKYLNGAKYRPSHIHFKITPPGFSPFITQLYFEGDTDIETDAAASISTGEYDASGRIIPLTTNGLGEKEGVWDIILDGDGVNGIKDVHLDKGVIYEVSPNPFSHQLIIKYGVFKKANVSIVVFDALGRIVANLANKKMPAGKYEAEWKPETNLPNGHYFVALKINDLQIHYLKVLKQK